MKRSYLIIGALLVYVYLGVQAGWAAGKIVWNPFDLFNHYFSKPTVEKPPLNLVNYQ